MADNDEMGKNNLIEQDTEGAGTSPSLSIPPPLPDDPVWCGLRAMRRVPRRHVSSPWRRLLNEFLNKFTALCCCYFRSAEPAAGLF